MRPAPPVAATLARLAAGMHCARCAPACARVPPCCAHTRAQVAIVTMVINIHTLSCSASCSRVCRCMVCIGVQDGFPSSSRRPPSSAALPQQGVRLCSLSSCCLAPCLMICIACSVACAPSMMAPPVTLSPLSACTITSMSPRLKPPRASRARSHCPCVTDLPPAWTFRWPPALHVVRAALLPTFLPSYPADHRQFHGIG